MDMAVQLIGGHLEYSCMSCYLGRLRSRALALKFPESATGQVSFAARDLIRGLLVKEPLNRLASKRGAAEIKAHPFFEGNINLFYSLIELKYSVSEAKKRV
jgi:hypothetical protein